MTRRSLKMDLLEHPAFWAIHLGHSPISTVDPEDFEAALGLRPADVDRFYELHLRDEEAWPYFRIPLPGGYAVEVEYSNAPGDHQIRYLLRHDRWTHEIIVGKGGGHWMLPAFRWPELVAIWDAAEELSRAHAFLLLLPSVWVTPDDSIDDVRNHLTNSTTEAKLVPAGQVHSWVETLIASFRDKARWRRDKTLGWIHEGGYSYRNPKNSFALKEAEFRELETFFKTIAR